MRHRDPLTDEQREELDALDRALSGEPVPFELRELGELVRDVRATAPEMSPAFAARLEHELQEGFPASREPVPATVRRPLAGRRWLLLPAAGSLAAVLVALVVVLGGGGDEGTPVANDLGSGGSEAAIPADGDAAGSAAAGPAADSGAESSAGSGDSAADRPSRSSAAPDPAATAAPSTAVAPSPPAGAIAPAPVRRVQRGAVLALRTPSDEFARTTDAVIATVGRFGGIVATSQIGDSDAAGGEAMFDLRVPTERLDQALAALSKLGHVTERTQSLQDITSRFTSAQERLTDARAERRGLLRALARATTQNQVASIKAQLRNVSSRIAGAKGELSSLRRRADLSQVAVTVRGDGEGGAATGGGSWTPGDAAGDALRVLEILAGIALVGLAVLAPLALLTGAVVLAVRGGRRRRREAALDPA